MKTLHYFIIITVALITSSVMFSGQAYAQGSPAIGHTYKTEIDNRIYNPGDTVSDCGNTLSNQYLASYTHSGGDSGAPVFTTPSGGNTVLVGIHVGDLTVGSVSHAVFSGFGAVQSELGVK